MIYYKYGHDKWYKSKSKAYIAFRKNAVNRWLREYFFKIFFKEG